MKVNGSPTKMTRGGVNVVRFDSDSDAVIWPLNVGPTAMPQATFAVCFYLNSKANNYGWLFGSEDTGCDRYVLVHDNRVGGTGPSCKKTNWGLGQTPVGQWNHVVVAYDQKTKQSWAFLNGKKGTVGRGIVHSDSGAYKNQLWLGGPHHNGHYANTDVATARVWRRTLSDAEVAEQYSLCKGAKTTGPPGPHLLPPEHTAHMLRDVDIRCCVMCGLRLSDRPMAWCVPKQQV